MFKSMPFIAILVAHTTHLYSMYTFIQLFPKYLGDIQGKSIKDIGFLASMPQTLTVFLIIFGSNISDWLYGNGNISMKTPIICLIPYEQCKLSDSFESHGYSWKNIRRGLNCFGSIIPAGFCFLYFTFGCNIVAVISFAVITQVKLSDSDVGK